MSLLWDDLKKRRVVKVGFGYLFAAVALVLMVAAAGQVVSLPDWMMRLVAGTAFVMMPFVIVMTWAIEDHGPENLRVGRRR